MHFTIVFTAHESVDLSFSLCFVPCPVWMQGDNMLLNLHPENPAYETGDLKQLLRYLPEQPAGKNVVVIVQPTGHGTAADQHLLVEELKALDFIPQVVYL